MTVSTENLSSAIVDDEKSTPVMVYTSNRLSWGDLVTKQSILPERILIGVSIPDFITLCNAQTSICRGSTLSKPNKFTKLHIPYQEIIGYHLMPPHVAQLDYDLTEQNRVMAPVTIQVGNFDFQAKFRISTQTSIKTMLDVTKSDFISVYDVVISHPGNPNMKSIQVNFALVSRMSVTFGESA